MRLPADRYELYQLFCCVYIGLGLCCLACGVYLIYVNRMMGNPVIKGVGPIALILVVFGPARIVNSLWVMRNLRRQRAAKLERGGL